MTDITLQMSFDSSYIDFNIDSEAQFLHKVSLLSVGNSYARIPEDETEVDALRNYLLPWVNTDVNDPPTHLRVWGVKLNGANYEIVNKHKPINIPISSSFDFGTNESKLIQEYFLKQLTEQVTKRNHLMLQMKNEINIEIDENYVADQIREGKAHSATAQMAQKLFPYNEKLGFLFLSADEAKTLELGFNTITNHYQPTNLGYVFFPVSEKSTSIWYAVSPADFNDRLCQLEYENKSVLNDYSITRIAYTQFTETPGPDVPIGNVTLREDSKYVGRVKTVVERGNDWKVNLTAELTKVLDFRKVFLEDKTMEETVKDTDYIKRVFDSFLLPFLNLDVVEKTKIDAVVTEKAEFWDTVKKIIIDTAIAKTNNHSLLESTIKSAETDCIRYFKRIRSNRQLDINSEKLNWVIEQLFFQGKKFFDYAQYHNKKENFKTVLGKLKDALSDTKNQTILLSVLSELDFVNVAFAKEDKIKFENEMVICEFKDGTKNTSFPLISLFNFDIFFLFNSYLLHFGKIKYESDTTDAKDSFLGYLLSACKTFGIAELKKQISLKIPEVLVTDVNNPDNNRQFYFSTNKLLEKQTTIDVNELDTFIKNIIDSFAKDTIQPTNDQVPIRIQIGRPDQIQQTTKDDLADELSGYVVLSTRSKAINGNQFHDWKYHNRTHVKRILAGKPDTQPLLSPFLLPGYLPVENETQKIFLEISNEKASLSATLEKLNQSVREDSKGQKTNLIHFLEKDRKNNPYGLIYGYQYQFAAFAILNSGVLPEVLREKPQVLNDFKEEQFDFSNVKAASHRYLRTKKVSAPGVKALEVKKYPSQLNPLYFELFGKENDDQYDAENKPVKKGKRNDLIVVGTGFNNKFIYIVEKPRTSFWDCYSFVHDGGDDPVKNMSPYKLLNLNEAFSKEEEYKRFVDFIDPAVHSKFYVEIEEQYSFGNKGQVVKKEIEYKEQAHGPNGEILNLPNCSQSLSFILGTVANGTKLEQVGNKWVATLKPGSIYAVRFYNLVSEEHFDDAAKKIHDCIKDQESVTKEGKFYKIGFEEQIIETAHFQNTITSEDLWKSLEITNDAPWLSELFSEKKDKENSIKALVNIKNKDYNLYSRIEVQHQKWEWNGRQINVDLSQVKDSLDPTEVKNGIYKTTTAMEFEAWTQSDRPDYTSYTSESRLYASEENKINIVHEYKDVIDNHSMYLKYSVEMFNRYELLGAFYKNDRVKSEIPIEIQEINGKEIFLKNPWKRHLKLSRRKEKLPTPSVRFYIPLTNSIKEANDYESHIADVMLVLDDVWYKEAGLAQKLALGIKSSSYKDVSELEDLIHYFPEAGFDVTLSTTATKEYLSEKHHKNTDTRKIVIDNGFPHDEEYILVDDSHIKGPFGFTFDFNATNAKINSSSFIISGDKLATYIGSYDKKEPFWPMFRLAVRSEIIPELHEGKDTEDLTSKWGSPEWVQFMKAVDSFVPDNWRNQVRQRGFVSAPNPLVDINSLLFKDFETAFGDNHNWYLIFSTTETNIGGLNVENYYDTYIVNNAATLPSLKSVHSDKDISLFTKGYVRVMVVRKSDDYKPNPTENIWDELFGKKEDGERIKDDNLLAMPILSERIPITIKK